MVEGLQFKLITPEKVIIDQQASLVIMPGDMGDMGVLPFHKPLLTLLRPGFIIAYQNETIFLNVFVETGIAEITPSSCTLFIHDGIPIENLDKSILENEIKKLTDTIKNSKTTEQKKHVNVSLELAKMKLMGLLTKK